MIGICNLSNIPVRREPESKSEMVSQLLFGEAFEVVENINGWTNIISKYDNYTGWINSKQFKMLESTIQHETTSNIFPFIEASSSQGKIMILAGSSLPNIIDNICIINNIEYTFAQQNKNLLFSDIETIATQYENVPYLWGGRTPFGIDCSGFTQIVYKQIGVSLKRDAHQQAEQGELVSFKEECKCGDLAFFDNDEGRITHVGIMLNSNKIIHASGKVRIDEMDNYGVMNKEENQYSHKLRIIKRMVS